MPLHVIEKDITTLEVDAIVNSTNEYLIGFSGVDNIIHDIGGEELEKECEPLRETCFLGESIYTNAYNLPCKYLIHTITPGWRGGHNGEAAILRSCYRTALEKAVELKCKSVAFPLIAAGSMRYPIVNALEIAITSIREYLSFYSDMDVYLTLYGDVVTMIARSMYGDLDSFVGTTYKPANKDSVKNLDELVNKTGEGFVTMLTRLIDEKGLTDAQVYKKAGVSKGTFNKILNGGTKRPSIETVSALAMALELSYDQTVQLLASAGMAFSDSSKFDIIVRYFIENGEYNIWKLDEQLIKYGYPPLLGAE